MLSNHFRYIILFNFHSTHYLQYIHEKHDAGEKVTHQVIYLQNTEPSLEFRSVWFYCAYFEPLVNTSTTRGCFQICRVLIFLNHVLKHKIHTSCPSQQPTPRQKKKTFPGIKNKLPAWMQWIKIKFILGRRFWRYLRYLSFIPTLPWYFAALGSLWILKSHPFLPMSTRLCWRSKLMLAKKLAWQIKPQGGKI